MVSSMMCKMRQMVLLEGHSPHAAPGILEDGPLQLQAYTGLMKWMEWKETLGDVS